MKTIFFWITICMLALWIQVRHGHKVTKLTVCSSMCSVNRDGPVFSVSCHTKTPNSFSAIMSNQTSLLTWRQMVCGIITHGINTRDCSQGKRKKTISKSRDSKGRNQAAKGFIANTIFAGFEFGTYSYNMKRGTWKKTGTHLSCLQRDFIRKSIIGCKPRAIIEFDATIEGIQPYDILLTFFNTEIIDFGYDVRTRVAFVVDKEKKLYRNKELMPKINKAGSILNIRLDQEKRKMYLLVRRGIKDTLCSCDYGGEYVQKHVHIEASIFISHFDYLYSRFLVRYISRNRAFYFPGEERADVTQSDIIDIDYDDTHMFIISPKTIYVRGRDGHGNLTIKVPNRRSGYFVSITVV